MSLDNFYQFGSPLKKETWDGKTTEEGLRKGEELGVWKGLTTGWKKRWHRLSQEQGRRTGKQSYYAAAKTKKEARTDTPIHVLASGKTSLAIT